MNLRGLIMLVHTVVWATIGIVALVFDPTAHLFMFLARVGWARQVLWLGGVELTVVGLEHLDPKQPYIIVANHLSQLDIPILIAALPIPIRFLAKRSLFYIPLFGWALALARFVAVDRGSTRKARRSIDRAAEKVRRGRTLAIFPEGTRSPDGVLHKFKSGAFVMGVKSGVPILPVAIAGSFEIVPKTTLAVQPGPVRVVVGRPLPTAGLSMEAKETLRKGTQQQMAQLLDAGEPA
jgi:1-acyl-sn-glycerol-3-phosphate acyltransferase